jgi:hypothetical protein
VSAAAACRPVQSDPLKETLDGVLPLVEEGAEALGTVPTSVPQSIEEARPCCRAPAVIRRGASPRLLGLWSWAFLRRAGCGVLLRPGCPCIDTPRLSPANSSHGCGKPRSKAAIARLMA